MYVDAEAAVRAWLNARLDLVGSGNAISHGAHLQHLRSPGSGAYALLSRVGGTQDLTAEQPVDRARISAQFYAGTKQAAEIAARAYANALAAINGAAVPMGDHAVCLVVDNPAGPLFLDQYDAAGEQFRYQVDADFFLVPA